MQNRDKLEIVGVSQIIRVLRARTLLTLLLLMISGTTIAARGEAIHGKVIFESDNTPVIGASVVIENSNQGTITSVDGSFTLSNVPESGNVNVSYIGYNSESVAIIPGKSYTIKLSESSEQIEEVVVVGYGTMRRKEVTGAVARISNEEITKVSTADLGTMLQGQIAGVNVQAASGTPGESSNIQIRGISSISGDNSPLYVVDGVAQSSDPGLSAAEIESIDVLKDAASAAIYGTRGAAGVILITTKRGEAGKMKITFDGYYGVQLITSDMSLMNSTDYNYVKMLQNRLSGSSGSNTDNKQWTSLKNYTNNFFNDSNLYDVITNDIAPVQNYAVTARGGQKNITYSLMANYYNQEGVIINSNYERYNMRGDLNLKRGKFTLNTNVGIKIIDNQTPGSGLLTQSYITSPTSSQIDPDESISQGSGSDEELSGLSTTMARIKETNRARTNSYSINLFLGYDILESLSLSTRFSSGYGSEKSVKNKPLFELYDDNGDLKESTYTRSQITNTNAINTSMTWETMLNWNKKFKKHEIKATGVFGVEQYTYERFYASIKDLVANDIPSINVGTSDALVGGGGSSQWDQDRSTSLVGMLARAQYNYDGRYMVSASVRRDGSSRFGKDNRWGVFPSASAAWNISDEQFWSPLKRVIGRMKLRASFGTTGNQSFADYSFASTITQNYDAIFGTGEYETLISGAAQTSYANSEIKWETTQQLNLGLDFSMLKNNLTFSFDIYQSNKKDMLFPLALPSSNGVGSSSDMTINAGDMRNRGVELAVQYRRRFKKWSFNANTTFAMNDNVVTQMAGNSSMYYFSNGNPISVNSTSDKVTVVKEGYEAGAFMVMPTNGIINSEVKLAEYQNLVGSARMGDLIYVDTNKDGKIDLDDCVYGGSGMPEFEIGLNYTVRYKGFDLYMNWYSSIGNEIINASKIYGMQYQTHPDLIYQWSENNPTSSIPAHRGSSTHDNFRANADIWIEDGSFVRLRNISLGYSLPSNVLKKIKLSKIRFYVAADNIWTITKYDGYNPEVGNNGLSRRGLDFGTYPTAAIIKGGLQLGF